MKNYNSYMDRQEISAEVHKKLLNLTSPKRTGHLRVQYGTLAACAALIVGVGVWRLAPVPSPAQSAGQFAAGYEPFPGETDTVGPKDQILQPDNEILPDLKPAMSGKETQLTEESGELEGSSFATDIGGTPLWRGETFASLDEVRQATDFAPYLPAETPKGYGGFIGRLSRDALSVWWSRGYDDIQISVYPEGAYPYHMADLNRPETYDLRLYTIPWCDSVPAEYRETVNRPAFLAEDMSSELVEARGSEKDTGGLHFNFDVLHPDGTLVHYDCSGLTAQQVWTLVEPTL